MVKEKKERESVCVCVKSRKPVTGSRSLALLEKGGKNAAFGRRVSSGSPSSCRRGKGRQGEGGGRRGKEGEGKAGGVGKEGSKCLYRHGTEQTTDRQTARLDR